MTNVAQPNDRERPLAPSAIRFFDAVYKNRIPNLRAILKRDKLDPNITDTRKDSRPTALTYACENQKVDLARALLRAKPVGANVDKADGQGRRPIWLVCVHRVSRNIVNELQSVRSQMYTRYI